ncbi:hypothetical protein CYY_000622 [Polysphondylium violaceum]|uniref:Uncharacterized protein n=1 Tax=Polysphondylium violaceum TaxID=133409 RepID=A0A8J4QAN3_9MYCE|nr:hypothetical protein CYY_000622 [Polysphondylium violaceum]
MNIIIVIFLLSTCCNVISSTMFGGYMSIEEDREKISSTYLFPTNSNDFIIISTLHGDLFRLKVSQQRIVKNVVVDNLYQNQESGSTSTGYLDDDNNRFYFATTRNSFNTTPPTVDITCFDGQQLSVLNSFMIENESIPFNQNSFFVDVTTGYIYLIGSSRIFKFVYNVQGLQFVQSITYPISCIFPSSAAFNSNKQMIYLGCTASNGFLYEISMSNLNVTHTHMYYYGESILSLLLAPLDSYTFIGGTPKGRGITDSVPFHIVSFSIDGQDPGEYRDRQVSYGEPSTAASDGKQYGVFVFEHEIMLINLVEMDNSVVGLDYYESFVGLTSVYSSSTNQVIVTTNSSYIYFYNMPNTTPPHLVVPYYIAFPVLIVGILIILLICKFIHSCIKCKKSKNSDYTPIL